MIRFRPHRRTISSSMKDEETFETVEERHHAGLGSLAEGLVVGNGEVAPLRFVHEGGLAGQFNRIVLIGHHHDDPVHGSVLPQHQAEAEH